MSVEDILAEDPQLAVEDIRACLSDASEMTRERIVQATTVPMGGLLQLRDAGMSLCARAGQAGLPVLHHAVPVFRSG